ncbi:tyrosine-type recombinase/integrase [Alkalibacter mobilis]|uniref:tyrosine-type recombinase/integrase n=1 Tax=Alkalibacter mobilis TaxID=2787712 RepID=UPI00189CA063|nr:tyrosine-type recombinase/integrase [Alkalibacter mobilis]MBF7095723.1 tyrosine-type recombinase/integrase [Alkalibacter mobilis]
MNMAEILINYKKFLIEVKELDGKTINSYYYDINGFMTFINKRTSFNFESDGMDISKYFNKLRMPDIYSYVNYLKYSEKKSDSTINRKLTSLDSFFFYLKKIDMLNDSNIQEKIKRFNVGKYDPSWINFAEIDELLNRIQTRNRRRDLALLILISECALRARDIINLKIHDYDGLYLTGNESTIKLGDKAISALDDYLENERKNIDSEFLFTSQKNNSISIRTIQDLIKKLNVNLNTNYKLTSDSLRNTAIIKMISTGKFSEAELKNYAGNQKYYSLKKISINKSDLAAKSDFLDLSKISAKTSKK